MSRWRGKGRLGGLADRGEVLLEGAGLFCEGAGGLGKVVRVGEGFFFSLESRDAMGLRATVRVLVTSLSMRLNVARRVLM